MHGATTIILTHSSAERGQRKVDKTKQVQKLRLLIIYVYHTLSYTPKNINSKVSTGKVLALLHSAIIHSHFLSSTNW